MVTYSRLYEVLHYDIKTGIFTWKITLSNNAVKGDVAGSRSHGYIQIGIDGTPYLAHRLAWLYVHGYFPESFLDHKDRVRHHNWISNLRESSNQCNQINCGNPKDNTSGVKGVCWDKSRDKWLASIKVMNKDKHLGRYKDFDNAVCARLVAEQCLDWADCNSNSPAYKYVQKMLGESKICGL